MQQDRTEPADGGLPRAVAITWGMVADPQRGPKRELSHERIVEAAIALADAEGLGAVTMSKVANALGFTTMALYRYVSAKDDLLQLMQDAAAGEMLAPADQRVADAAGAPAAPGAGSAGPDGGSEGSGDGQPDDRWRSELHRFAGQLRGVYRDHPWMTELPVSTEQLLTPNNLAVADHAMRAMRTLPLTDAEKIGTLLLITTFVRAQAQLERDISRQPDDHPGRAALISQTELIKELVTEERFPDLHPLVASGAYLGEATEPVTADDPSNYEFGLQLILDGIAAYARRSGPATGSPATEPGHRSDDQLAAALDLDHVRRDAKVKEAVRQRREAEAKLREARKREREMIKNALERGPKGR